MEIKHWKRNVCRLCSSKSLEKILDLKPVPIGEKYSDSPFLENQQRFPIDLYNCKKCNAIQVLDNVDQEFLWSEYTYFSGQTESIIKHQHEFVHQLTKDYKFKRSPKVIDIGSNDGTLLQGFKKKGFQVYGIDPAETVASVAIKNGIETLVGLFSDKIIPKIPQNFHEVDLITAFNVFAHSDDMEGMIGGVKKLLKSEGIFCFEVQYLVPILDKKLLGTIFHEHMIHYSVTSANNFLKENGLKIINIKENNIQKGSIIFYAAKRNSPLQSNEIVKEMLSYEENNGYLDGKKFQEFENHIEKLKQQIKKLKKFVTANNLTICAFGAARSGPTLAIQYGLENIFSFIVDDHPSKVKKYAPFENLPVKSSINLIESKPDYAVILAWIHAKQVIKKNVSYLEQGGTFITLWPDYEEITIENYKKWLNEKN